MIRRAAVLISILALMSVGAGYADVNCLVVRPYGPAAMPGPGVHVALLLPNGEVFKQGVTDQDGEVTFCVDADDLPPGAQPLFLLQVNAPNGVPVTRNVLLTTPLVVDILVPTLDHNKVIPEQQPERTPTRRDDNRQQLLPTPGASAMPMAPAAMPAPSGMPTP